MSKSYRLISSDEDRDGLIVVTISGQYADELHAELHWPSLEELPAGTESFDHIEHALLQADIISARYALPRASVSMENPALWDAGWGPVAGKQI